MSVLVRDCETNKYYVFVKGAPEKIERMSVVKIDNIEKIVQDLSLGGYRNIGFGYKEIEEEDIELYMKIKREEFDEGIQSLGIIAFENKLK